MPKQEISPAERKRRSEQAKKMHAEGKLGGAGRGQGRPRKKRANERIADEVSKRHKEISESLFGILTDDKTSNNVKMKAALALLDIENKETDRQERTSGKDFESATREQILAYILEHFPKVMKSLPEGAKLPFDVESTAKEIT